jgi:hypothetical protein
MPWTYHQRTGRLVRNGHVVATGYSGHGHGINNPNLEQMRNVGPIPRGRYMIGAPYNSAGHGPHVMALTPNGHAAHGRDNFLIHGDNGAGNRSASEGCIILGPDARRRISSSGDNVLNVEM